MPKAIIMPKFGMTQEEATIVRWMVKEGERVESGDPLCEVTTDKINMEVEATTAGILTGVRFPEGAVVAVTEVIAYIRGENEPDGETSPPSPAPGEGDKAAPLTRQLARSEAGLTPVARRMAEAEGLNLNALKGSGLQGKITSKDVLDAVKGAGSAASGAQAPGKVRATPAARRIAAEHGVDLCAVSGSGFDGRIQGADVRALLERSQAGKGSSEASAPAQAQDSGQKAQPLVIPLEGMRKTIAQRMQASYQQAPHITLTLDMDMTRACHMRTSFNSRMPAGRPKVSMTAVIVKACAAALADYPLLNSYLKDEQIYLMPEANIGVAVALDDGLIVPVVRAAGEKTLFQVGAEVADLSRRAREGRLQMTDLVDGTFTLTNLGMLGIDHFTAIINPPQVGILAVGRIARRFVFGENDRPVVRSMMTVTLSADHRVVDGAYGARFLGALRDILETAGTQWG